MSDRPLIAHVLYRLDTGGMERFVLTLVNGTADRFRHAVVCLTEFGPMRREITDPAVPCLALHKRPGKDWMCHAKLWKALRALKPDLVHSYNIGTLDVAPIAKIAGVRCIVHAERGRDASDPHGENRRYRILRRWMSPFVARWLPVSRDLESWLVHDVGIDPTKVVYIPNGIDVGQFASDSHPAQARSLLGGFAPPNTLLIGNVARLDKVKDQTGLLAAFKLLGEQAGPQAQCRLVIAGEGPEHAALQSRIEQLGLTQQIRLLGNRSDVAALLAECDVFVLSSIAEGMPMTVLEAMAAGLPVVATDVGGVASVVEHGVTGTLVPPGDPAALAQALRTYVADGALRRRHGDAGRVRVIERFSLSAMLSAYTTLYDKLLGRPEPAAPPRMATGLAKRGGA